MTSPEEALALLEKLGATPWLIRHHELVLEAAQILCVRFRGELGMVFDERLVLLGAALHDAGKILHPGEMRGPGHAHEAAGQELLIANGVPEDVARFCVTHAEWEDCALEDKLVALADKLWKGKRVDALEFSICGSDWNRFNHFDAICEAIAEGADDRLSRSRV